MSEREESGPSVLVTGGEGLIGRVLAAAWTGRLTSFDLPGESALDRERLTAAARGHDAIVHLAWDKESEDFLNNGFAPENLAMAVNAVEAAVAAGVPRLVLASSVHADTFWPPPRRPLTPTATPVPDSPYGASKVFMEALGRHAARFRGLEVVAIRFGGVNPADRRPDEPSERAVWLSHADCVALVRAAVSEPLPPERFALVTGIGESPWRIHDPGDQLPWPSAPVSRSALARTRLRLLDARMRLRRAVKALR
jgi:uronate dehydrogenase